MTMTAERCGIAALFLTVSSLTLACQSTQEHFSNSECSEETQCLKDRAPGEVDDFILTTQMYRDAHPSVHPNSRYNVWNCPTYPSPGYPRQWKASKVLADWHPDNTSLPASIYQGLCVFDASDHQKAMNYLEADVPFVILNTPDFVEAARRWQDSRYVEEILGNATYPLYTSASNQFLYWRRMESPPNGWKPPSEYSRVTYEKFRELMLDRLPNETHHYMYAEGHWSASDEHYRWPLFDEFPRFKPGNTDVYHELFHQDYQTLYFKFGMKGNTAVMHFDQQRNTIVMIKGQRRYLLADPSQCPELHLRNKHNPSSRHTTLDLRDFPESNSAMMNEIILQPGDALILPSFWFHSVIGLTSDNVQVNTWSTATASKKRTIQECGEFL